LSLKNKEESFISKPNPDPKKKEKNFGSTTLRDIACNMTDYILRSIPNIKSARLIT
jgi:hypothetical protein